MQDRRTIIDSNMASCSLLCLVLLSTAVVAVQTQYPRLEFGDEILVNNSYIPRGFIGEGMNDSLRCVTNNTDCCNNGQGNWYDEREMIVGDSGKMYVSRGDQVVYLHRNASGNPSGLWRCDIPDSNNNTQSIYIYLGSQTEGIAFSMNDCLQYNLCRQIDVSGNLFHS